MKRAQFLAAAVLATAVGIAGCSTPSSTADTNTDGVPLRAMDASEYTNYSDIVQLASSSDYTLVAHVAEVEHGPIYDEGEDIQQIAIVHLESERTLHGDPPATLSFAMLGWLVDEDDRPLAEYVVEGVRIPAVGTRLLLFLDEAPADDVRRFGASHALVSYDGIFALEDGVLTTTLEGSGRLGHELAGSKLDDVAELMDSA